MSKISILFIVLVITFIIACAPKKTSQNGISYSDLSQEDFRKLSYNDYQLIDVRTPGEIANGKISPSALEIDYKTTDFTDKVNKLDKNKNYIVYCKSGGRSARASQIMIDNGFTSVANLLGGYDQWSSK